MLGAKDNLEPFADGGAIRRHCVNVPEFAEDGPVAALVSLERVSTRVKGLAQFL